MRASRLKESRESYLVKKMYDEIYSYNEEKYRELLQKEEATV